MNSYRNLLTMSDTLHIAITPEQRDLLLRGLRFIRSSVLLRVGNPGEEDRQQREAQLQQIEELVDQLKGSPSAAGV